MQDNNQEEKKVEMNGQEYDVVGGVACPIDPFEREMCDSCQ